MGSQIRRFGASETVNSDRGFHLYLFFLLCLGFLSRSADYSHTANSGSNNVGSIGKYFPAFKFLAPKKCESANLEVFFNISHSPRFELDSSGDLRMPKGLEVHGLTSNDDETAQGNELSEVDPQRCPWIMVGGMEQIELVIDYKIPKGTSAESSLNLPSSAICLDSIPKILLTLLRDETIEIMGIIKKLCHIDEFFHDPRANEIHCLRDLPLDNDCELRTKVISILVAGIIIFLLISTAKKRIGNVILFKSNHELDALVLQESDLDESYLADQNLYDNLLKEAVLVSEGSSGKVFKVALDVMLQIAEGMSYMHRQGIAHQDLKSLNILLKLRGEYDDPDFQILAKVADFGSARRFDPRCPTGFVLFPNMNIGTRSWRAPELFHPRGSFWTRFFGVNPRVLPKPLDIYGFAVICSELLTKQIPFSHDKDLRLAVLASKLREGHRPALPSTGCPEELLALIKDCWHRDPVLRPEFHEVCTRLIEVKSFWMSRGQRRES